MDKSLIGILLIFAVISFTGCRKSAKAHQERSHHTAELTSVKEDVRSTRTHRIKVDSRKTTQKHSNNKLEGSEIFAKYNTAVFMVFTQDGYNGYQGSGFFINSDGLAVSNYHVFHGTYIGAEQIKLANSNEAYKVAEVIHSSEDEDFILFRVNVSNTNYIRRF